MMPWTDHLAILPVALPVLVSAVMVVLSEGRRALKGALSVATVAALLATAIWLAVSVSHPGAPVAWTYAAGSWPAPFGIVLVVDRLSALMLVLASFLGLAALLFSLTRQAWAGPRFPSLFLLLLAGVNGAVLTGDLFNLFVFFEVMLAASYGLLLHGSGEARVRAGLHYIAVNVTASLLFLLGASLIYGAAGTLNMADLARRLPELPPESRQLVQIAAAILATTFLTKAAIWPLGFWLPTTYAAAPAPSAAVFTILSKVGVYVVLRLSSLLFGAGEGELAGFGSDWLFWGGLVTVLYGTCGVLGTRALPRAAGHCVTISSGTVLAVLGAGGPSAFQAALSGSLYYMAGSVLAGGALFLLADILERDRAPGDVAGAMVFDDEFEDPYAEGALVETDPVIPAAVALASVGFLLAGLLLAGIPPFAGFVGKLAMFLDLLGPPETPTPWPGWALIAALTLSSLGVLVGLLRFGIAFLWEPSDAPAPTLRRVELAAVAGLLLACLALTVWGEAALEYARATVTALGEPGLYVAAVLGEAAP
jgi:multicomponent K+:H+ antiporter subunit D